MIALFIVTIGAFAPQRIIRRRIVKPKRMDENFGVSTITEGFCRDIYDEARRHFRPPQFTEMNRIINNYCSKQQLSGLCHSTYSGRAAEFITKLRSNVDTRKACPL